MNEREETKIERMEEVQSRPQVSWSWPVSDLLAAGPASEEP